VSECVCVCERERERERERGREGGRETIVAKSPEVACVNLQRPFVQPFSLCV
jgi:hypothetical protein